MCVCFYTLPMILIVKTTTNRDSPDKLMNSNENIVSPVFGDWFLIFILVWSSDRLPYFIFFFTNIFFLPRFYIYIYLYTWTHIPKTTNTLAEFFIYLFLFFFFLLFFFSSSPHTTSAHSSGIRVYGIK